MPVIFYKLNVSLKLRSEKISSEKIREALFFSGQCPDALYTGGPRYSRLLSNDLLRNHGAHPSTQGCVIDFTAQHHFITSLITLIILGLTGLAWLYYWSEERLKSAIAAKEEEKKEYKSTHANIINKFNSLLLNSNKDEAESNDTALVDLEKLQSALQTVLNGPRKHEFARFKNATIKKEREGVSLVFKPPLSITNILMTTWNMFFLMAFIYWLGWIISGTYLGILGVGFASCIPLISFGLPVSFGLLYVGVKLKNWYQHQQEDCASTLEEVVQADKLMAACHEAADLQSLPLLQQPEQQNNNTVSSGLRIVAAFIIGAASAFTAAHYILWLLSDASLLSLTLCCTNFFGIAAFVVAGISGAVAARQKHNEIVNMPRSTLSIGKLNQQKEEYPGIKLQIKKIKADLREKAGKISILAGYVGNILQSPYYKTYDYFMSAVFITRVFVLVCTSPFLPTCFHMAAAVAVLSNTAVLLILIGAGVVWAAFRTCVRIAEEKATFEKEYASAKAELAMLQEHQRRITPRSVSLSPTSARSVSSLEIPLSPIYPFPLFCRRPAARSMVSGSEARQSLSPLATKT